MAGRKGFHTNSPELKTFKAVAVEALKVQHSKYLLQHKSLFPDFWRKYCLAYRVSQDELENNKHIRTRALNRLNKLKFDHHGKGSETKKKTKVFADNYVIYHVTDTVHKKAKDDVVIKKKTKILKAPEPDEKKKRKKIPNQKSIGSVSPDNESCLTEVDFSNPESNVELETEIPSNPIIVIEEPQEDLGKFIRERPYKRESETEVIKESSTTTGRTIRSHRVEARKISQISFASPITVATVSRIEAFAKFKEELAKDYLYFLAGGEDEYEKLPDGRVRRRYKKQLSHLEQGKQVRETLKSLTDDIIEKIKSGLSIDSDERRQFRESVAMLKSAMDASREVDLDSIQFINSLEEGEFSAQKALQGAILNDKAMVENGNIVLEQPEVQKIDTIDFESDIKKIGAALLEAHVDNINNKESVLFPTQEEDSFVENVTSEEEFEQVTIENEGEECLTQG